MNHSVQGYQLASNGLAAPNGLCPHFAREQTLPQIANYFFGTESKNKQYLSEAILKHYLQAYHLRKVTFSEHWAVLPQVQAHKTNLSKSSTDGGLSWGMHI
ncbi:hypothetical protein PROFUN_01345 [Planoprotostelium fungivorum]|uniref:Uncharacterized protein n=1 Tax=Planoprotostelium fungivorum TaxID=1890364 RepID=A0A2P6NZV8_9EUKA|nr:hypothetical protein PROFUN_01345 [Planoprotostelium fungivorum]